MDRPYWRRLWIMQEITACAPCENIYLGDHRISWRELVLLLQSYMSSQRIEMNDEYTETRHNRVQANIHQAYILTTMAETYRQGLGLGKRNTLMEYGSGSSWMYLGKTSEVTDERDRVYGILGLIPEKISCHIMPNYAKSVEEVYKDLSKALIKATGSFDDSFAGSITNNANLASWAIDMQDASSTLPKGGKAGGFHNPYDDFLKTGQMYRIKVHKKPTPDEPNVDEKNDSVHYEFSDDGTILTVVAIHVDTVEGISGSVIRYTSPLKIIDAAWKPCEQSLKPREGTSARETVLRVLTADAEYVDEPNSSLFDIPFFADLEPDATLVEELHNNGWSNILRSEGFRLLHKFRIRKGEYPLFEGKPFEEWFTKEVTPCDEEGMEKALQAVRRISERTFITTEKGNLGSTGVAVKEGDRIFVAPGCSFPFLVRPDGDNYRVVGECYLDGFMNGEALDMLENGELEIGPIQLQ
ncbi:hypothetical protein BKA66DRAFT_450431 [Pyrenochaeta sp. MPI-SDFR-AT-0127]|nr:hypothetical protein BKA66DRAFT_450431 [Pyrenochaeta sp. MPI-SDFR-AT-0127]